MLDFYFQPAVSRCPVWGLGKPPLSDSGGDRAVDAEDLLVSGKLRAIGYSGIPYDIGMR